MTITTHNLFPSPYKHLNNKWEWLVECGDCFSALIARNIMTNLRATILQFLFAQSRQRKNDNNMQQEPDWKNAQLSKFSFSGDTSWWKWVRDNDHKSSRSRIIDLEWANSYGGTLDSPWGTVVIEIVGSYFCCLVMEYMRQRDKLALVTDLVKICRICCNSLVNIALDVLLVLSQ